MPRGRPRSTHPELGGQAKREFKDARDCTRWIRIIWPEATAVVVGKERREYWSGGKLVAFAWRSYGAWLDGTWNVRRKKDGVERVLESRYMRRKKRAEKG